MQLTTFVCAYFLNPFWKVLYKIKGNNQSKTWRWRCFALVAKFLENIKLTMLSYKKSCADVRQWFLQYCLTNNAKRLVNNSLSSVENYSFKIFSIAKSRVFNYASLWAVVVNLIIFGWSLVNLKSLTVDLS